MKYAVLVAVILLLLFPIYWMFVGSVMDISGVMRMPPLFVPREPTLNNYRFLLTGLPIGLWVTNTVGMTAVLVVVSVAAAAAAGYAFATQRGVQWLYWCFLLSIMVPRQVLIIPLFILVRHLGLSGTRLAAILPVMFFPVGIFIYRNYVESIPSAMMDSARIDGANERQILLHIIAPLSRSALAALAVLQFIGGLTDYLWQFLVLQDPGRRTLIVGLLTQIMRRGGLERMNVNPIGMQMAAGVVLFLPLLAIFVVLQKSFVDGIMNGGIRA